MSHKRYVKGVVWAAVVLGSLWAAARAVAVPLTVEWSAVATNQDGTPLGDLKRYRLYRAENSFRRNGAYLTPDQAKTVFDVFWTVTMNSSQVSRTLDLAPNTSHYFRLTAVDTSSNESGFNVSASGEDVELVVYLTAPAVVSIGGTPQGLKEAYAYPNPAVGTDPVIRAVLGDMERVEITIFNEAGTAVHSAQVTQPVLVGGETAYQYRWTGEKGSGVYYAVVHGKKGGETVRARASFAVVR